MNCPGCAADVDAGDAFCPRCGSAVLAGETREIVLDTLSSTSSPGWDIGTADGLSDTAPLEIGWADLDGNDASWSPALDLSVARLTPIAVSEAPLVRIRNLRYRYRGAPTDVLTIPSLDISGKGLIALTGPSGAGKSTLVEILAGTLREPYDGSVQVLGMEWKNLRRDVDRQRHLRRIGLIPQDFGLLGHWTPRETVNQDLADCGVSSEEFNARAQWSLSAVGLQACVDKSINKLSGGQRRRVSIARMLARDVELVIADEPTANLDPALVEEILSLFDALARKAPVIIVTHDAAVAEYCARTIVLQSLGLSGDGPWA